MSIDQQVNSATGVIVLVAAIACFLIPTIVAFKRTIPAAAGVLLLNLVAGGLTWWGLSEIKVVGGPIIGFAFTGWFAALIWACTAKPAELPAPYKPDLLVPMTRRFAPAPVPGLNEEAPRRAEPDLLGMFRGRISIN